MTKIELVQIERTYTNNGIHAQQTYEFNKLGTISKHDNKPFWCGGDVGDVQVKSSHASVCKGLDIHAHIEMDGAKSYAYINKTFTIAYEMSANEYEEFLNEFAKPTRESAKNGGGEKMRLPQENKAIIDWLERLARQARAVRAACRMIMARAISPIFRTPNGLTNRVLYDIIKTQ